MRFRTTKDIFGTTEYFDANWIDSNNVFLPPKIDWDYSREMRVEDVDIWEVVYEQGGQFGVYAAWMPYAEFYMFRVGWELEEKHHGIETYYGPKAQDILRKRLKEFGIKLPKNKIWVEPSDMWLYI